MITYLNEDKELRVAIRCRDIEMAIKYFYIEYQDKEPIKIEKIKS